MYGCPLNGIIKIRNEPDEESVDINGDWIVEESEVMITSVNLSAALGHLDQLEAFGLNERIRNFQINCSKY